ncbi:hypothetical protein [Spirosoma jeollabukense]
MDFIVNEWLPEYLKPTASREDHNKVLKFFETLLKKENTRIIVRRPSPFLSKLFKIEKDFQNNPLALRPVKAFIKLVLLNSDKCLFVENNEIETLPVVLTELLAHGNYSSDTYLFEAAYTLPNNRIIVTTDSRLIQQVSGKIDCQLILLDEFLTTFNTT